MKRGHYILSILFLATIFSCKKKGCTDSDASNYNPEAKKDNNSCIYDTLTDGVVLHDYLSIQNTPSGIANTTFYCVTSIENTFFVSGADVIVKSTDGGVSWSICYSETGVNFYAIDFHNTDVGYAVGIPSTGSSLNSYGSLYRTLDGGNTWDIVYTETKPSSHSVNATSAGLGDIRNAGLSVLSEQDILFSIGDNYYRSSTGGKVARWSVKGASSYGAYFLNENDALIGVTGGMVYSNSGGVNFSNLGGASSNCYDIDFAGQLGFASNKATGFTTGGVTVTRIDDYTSNNLSELTVDASNDYDLFGVDVLNDSIAFFVGDEGSLYYTQTSGSSFVALSSGTLNRLNDITFNEVNSSIGIAVGENSTIIRIENGYSLNHISGQQLPASEVLSWSQVNSSVSSDLYKILNVDGTVFIAGDGVILKSTDNGVSFSNVVDNVSFDVLNISFENDQVGYASGLESGNWVLKKTTNGGQTWSVVNSNGNTSHYFRPFLSCYDNSYVLASNPNSLAVTSQFSVNGGASWSTENTSSLKDGELLVADNNLLAPLSVDGGMVLISSSKTNPSVVNTVYSTAGNGEPGTLDGFTGNQVKTLQNRFFMMVGTPEAEIVSSTNYYLRGYVVVPSSLNWATASDCRKRKTYVPAAIYGVAIKDQQEIYLVGEKGLVLKTANGGQDEITTSDYHLTWKTVSNLTMNERLNDAIILNNKLIVVGENGIIYSAGI